MDRPAYALIVSARTERHRPRPASPGPRRSDSPCTIHLCEGVHDRRTKPKVDVVPGARTMTEALGDERTDRHLTVASYGGAGGGLAQRHGHGSVQDEIDLDTQTQQYFRAVDRVVLEHYSSPLQLPLILAALAEHPTPFRRVSHNQFLLLDGVLGDPAAPSPDELRARAWSAMKPRYLERLATLVEMLARRAPAAAATRTHPTSLWPRWPGESTRCSSKRTG